MKVTQKYVNQLTYKIVGGAIEVHKQLGPALLETVYEECMIQELQERSLHVTSQVPVPIRYKGKALKHDLRIDLIVNDLIIIELKAVDVLLPVFKAQLLTYLRLTGKPKGLLINFKCENIVRHMVPLVSETFAKLDID